MNSFNLDEFAADVVLLNRNQMRKINGGNAPGCSFTTIETTCTCSAPTCKCQSGVGLPAGTYPDCISIWSDGSCNFAPSSACHG